MDETDYDALRANLLATYNGNRSPFGLFFHAGRVDVPKMLSFMEWAAAMPNVHFVTTRTLVNWMKNPVAASSLTAAMLCPKPAGEVACDPTQCDVGTRFRVCGDTCPTSELSPATYKTAVCPLRPAMCTGSDCLCGADEAPLCTVSQWSEWSACSAACGGGTKSRTRQVVVSGSDCPELTSMEPCNEIVCGGDWGCDGCWPGTSGKCKGANTVCYAPNPDNTCPLGTTVCCTWALHRGVATACNLRNLSCCASAWSGHRLRGV